MDKILAKIDVLIDKIPIHIRDLIQKGFFSIIAIVALFAIVAGIKRGIDHAKPGGVQLFGKNKDLFYIERLREDNAKKNKLIEDIEVYEDLFESRDERLHPTFQRLGKDTDDRIIGEREEFIKQDPLRKKNNNLMIEENDKFNEEYPVPDHVNDALKLKSKSEEIPLIDNQSTEQNVKNKNENYKNENRQKTNIEEGKQKSGIKIDSDNVKLID
ncbi:MAG: hypothetical protein OEV78_03150 [Spirochaetia bacterium]|nr:hypothetical protein [Spirochaetia bacterium]